MVSLAKAFATLETGEVSVSSDKAPKTDKAVRTKNDAKHRAESMATIPTVWEPYHAPEADADFATLLHLSKLTGAAFSRMTGTPLPTVKGWSRGKSAASGAALAYLRLVCAIKGCSSIEQVRAEIERAGSK